MSSFGMRPREPFLERHHVLAFVLLALPGLGLATLSLKQPERVRPLQDAGMRLTAPIAGLGSSASAAADGAITSVSDAFTAREQLEQARAEIEELKLKTADRDALAAENEALRATAGLAESLPLRTVAARVIHQQRSPDWILVLDRGTEAGIREDLAVISPDGVVGKVLSAGEGVSRVQCVLDGDAGVAVMIGDERRQADAIVSDGTATHCRLTHVELLADIREGDRVLTSGLDLVYPRGLLFGEVDAVESINGIEQEITVVPAVDFSRLEQVLVVLSSDARDRVREAEARPAGGARKGRS